MGLCLISAKEIETYRRRWNAYLIDLRDPEDYSQWHIPGARNVPVEELEAPVSILVSVSKRRFKRAVKRNRVKRQIREAYRMNKHGLLAVLTEKKCRLAVAFIYLSDQLVDSSVIEDRMKTALARIAEKVAANAETEQTPQVS